MPAARCNDPDCTCRSPELQWFTDQVLRRDAGKTDYMIIPLIAGALARCILADDPGDGTDPEGEAETRRAAAAVFALAEQGRTESWENDPHVYGVIASLVFCNWPSLLMWGSISYQRTTLNLPLNASSDRTFSATVKFLAADPPPSLTESVMLAMLAAVQETRGKGEMPLLNKGGRRLRVILADRLRRQDLTTWPKILGAAVDDWTLETVQRIARHNAAAGDAAIHFTMQLAEAEEAEAAQGARDVPQETLRPDATLRSAEAEAAEMLINETVGEIARLREQRAAAQRERDAIVQRDSRLRSHLESLERQVAEEKERRRALERENAELRAERDRYVERAAAETALRDDAALPAPDAFAGRRVLFFTGVESAETRTAQAQGFWDLGAAQVDTYWTDKTRGPDVFPPDAIVAIDVSLMAHSTWNAIVDKAKSASAWSYWGKHGATTMARATAAAWLERRTREG